MASKTLPPLACRVSRKQLWAIRAAAARRHLSVSRFIKNLLEPYFGEGDENSTVNIGVNKLLSDVAPSVPSLAPETRAPPERPAGRTGFTERSR
jgi:hypothetical protein